MEGAKRLDKMIDNLLEYSKIGSMETEFKYIDSEKMLEKVLTNLKPLIDENNTVITYDSLPIIYADDKQMTKLFHNPLATPSNTGAKNFH